MNRFNRFDDTPEAVAVGPDTTFPLTPTQLGMIYESNLLDRPWVNLEQVVSHLSDEPVNPATMQEAWLRLAARHDVLRTVFDWKGREEAIQTIILKSSVKVEMVDWTHMAGPEQDVALREWLAQDRARGVDLTRNPNWRVTWFQTGLRSSVLIWTFHHALLDGRSFTALLREVLDGYTALVAATPVPVENRPLPPCFAKHCRAVKSLDLSAAEPYFRQQFNGFDGPNKIDLGQPDPHIGPTNAARTADGRKRLLDSRLPVEVGEAMAARAAATGTSVATLVAVAWGIVLARCSGRGEAVFGTTRSGRYLVPEAKQMAGCLISTVPACMTTKPKATIASVLCDFRASQLAAHPYEHTPLSKIARWAGLPGGATLFESAVVFESSSVDRTLRARGGVWASRRFEVHEEGALPLTLAVYQDPSILVRLEYDPARYSKITAQRLLNFMLATLKALAAMPVDTPLSHIDMFAQDEREALLTWAAPPVLSAPDKTAIIDRFRRTAMALSDKTALRQAGTDHSIGFAELNARSDELANALTARSISPNAIVAIFLPRSFDFVVAALAVLKAGAAFLPVDPAYPPEVIAHILKDSATTLVLTNSDGTALPLAVDTMDVTSGLRGGPGSDQQTGATSPKAEDIAYVIYTSGSTGKPKGVMIPHAALSGHVTAVTQAFALCRDDRVLQFASLGFDVAIEEILPTLACGAELVLRSPDMAESPNVFLQETGRLALSVLNLPTAFWHALVDHMQATGTRLPGSVRLVIAGGEAIVPGVLVKFRQMQPYVRFLNGYGPTEATITATLFDPDDAKILHPQETVPIGRPLSHTRAYVVAGDGTLAPAGALGELWLGGAAVARGYLGQPKLTDERFFRDPFTQDMDARVYRTGDLARWRPDGTLAFVGRIDRQIKVNGFRIEPRQVELALEALPEVSLALVAADRVGALDSRLLAWVTASDPKNPPDAGSVCKAMRTHLPPHMIPVVTAVESFPRTPGGKIDHDALPRPLDRQPPTGAVQEQDETVRRVMGLFADILDVAPPGADASFFDLGGHSLLAVRLIGAVEAEFGHRLSISSLHVGPTPRQIAATVAATVPSAAARYIVPIQPKGTRPPIYGVHVLGMNESFYRPLAGCLGPDQPLFGLTIGAQTETEPTEVRTTAAAYCEDIQRFQPSGPICLAAVSLGSFIAFELAQQLRQSGREVLMLALFDAAGPGGRKMVGTGKRLKIHLRHLARKGPGYVARLVRNRYEDLKNNLEKARLRRLRYHEQAARVVVKVMTVVAANVLAVEAYDPAPYPGRLTVFRASSNQFDAPEAIAEGLGWAEVTEGGLEVIEVPGGHLSMLQPPNVATLARQLRRIIDDARQKDGAGRRPQKATNAT